MFSDNSSLQKVTRGGQVTLHVLRMYGQILKTIMCLVILVTISFNAMWYFAKNTTEQREIFGQYTSASFRLMLNKKATQELTDENGHKYTVSSKEFKNSPAVQKLVGDVFVNAVQGTLISVILAILSFVGVSAWLKHMGARATKDKVLNQHTLDKVKNVNKLLAQRNELSDLTIGDLHLVKESETKHIRLEGTTGSGKSNVIKSLISQIIAKGDRFIVFDKSCDLTNEFHHPDSSVVLNPFDERTPSWTVWTDARDSADFKSLAEALLPMPAGAGGDPFWITAARVLFATTAYQMRNEKDKSIVKLLKRLLTTSVEDMQKYLANTEAASLVSKEIEKTAVSIKTQLATYLSSLKYLKDEGEEFSMRKWIRGESDKQGVFITSLADKHHVLMPLISMWLDLSFNAVMSLTPSRQRRIWIIYDEAQSLHVLPSLFSGVNEVRKFGGCIVLASTSRFALTHLYGQDRSKAILGQFNTSIFFRTPDYDGSVCASKELGESEIEEVHENYSYGANSMRDGVSLTKQRVRRPVVSYTDIQQLPDHQAFVKLPGKYPISKVVFPLQKSTRMKETGFIPREVNEDIFTEVNELEDMYINRPQDAPEFKIPKKEEAKSVIISSSSTPEKGKPILESEDLEAIEEELVLDSEDIL